MAFLYTLVCTVCIFFFFFFKKKKPYHAIAISEIDIKCTHQAEGVYFDTVSYIYTYWW